MSVITFGTDSSTLVLNGYAFKSFVAGDIMTLAPANPLTSHINSTSGGVAIQKRSDSGVHDLTLRVERYSDDDIFLNSAINGADVTVFNGSMKENFNKDGVDGIETWSLESGSITTRPTSTKNDQDGNALSEYMIRFRNAVRVL